MGIAISGTESIDAMNNKLTLDKRDEWG